MASSSDINREQILDLTMPRRASLLRQTSYYFRRKPLGAIGIGIVLTVGLVALFAPWILLNKSLRNILIVGIRRLWLSL